MISDHDVRFASESGWRRLADFSLPSEPGNERRAMELVGRIVQPLGLSPARTERLRTAVAEATLNAIEHGNGYRRELPVRVGVWACDAALVVTVTDEGAGGAHPVAPEPDLEAKLNGSQSPRGWGLFLIKSMTDALIIHDDRDQHTIELVFYLNDGSDSSEGEAEADGS
ncbi:MAG: ATP-binding protein [Chloroflexota bacterium]|jgi:anti-sigma regulatory factor (Ser/Thr protein kinase)|nr:ATP-binding protein [Anaerolineae bacterium]HMM27172.1 ATP-binding protein [Aggregatilineaceae bacterium]